MKPAGSDARGFTLIEVLIAVTVFAVLAGAVYVTLNTLADAAFVQRQRSVDLADLQRALARLDADVRQLTTRPVRAANVSVQPALDGRRTRLEGSRTGWLNPQQQRRSDIQRFAWSIDSDSLIRTSWPVTDPAGMTPSHDETVLSDVLSLEFAYLDAAGQWLDSWPQGDTLQSLPRAVRYRLGSERFGVIERLIALP